jgi:branched-chain amino acid transport system substrate-binding protein
MRKLLLGLACSAGLAALVAVSSAQAQQVVKVGLIMAYSGQFADTAAQIDNGVKLYMKQNGDTVAGKKIEIIRRDTGGPNPDVAKRLAQELVVRDKVDIIAGFTLTPEALGASDISAQAKKFMVIMNAATSIITTKSDYSVRTSMTLPQIGQTLGQWAAKSGTKKAYTMVSDFGPGHDAEGAFQTAFKAAGGEIVGSVRMPVANPDFSAFVQRAKDLNPESIFIFVPGGARQGLRRARCRLQQGEGDGQRRGHGRAGPQEHGRRLARPAERLALRLQPRLGEEQGLRAGLQRRIQAQPGLLRGRRL